ncbi:MAG: substrate-binding domain-containing protein [Bacillota bacterium]
MGAFRALHEEELSVPDRVNIIGVNDISVAKYVYPPLSSVKVQTEVMGETAVVFMMKRLEQNKKSLIKCLFHPSLSSEKQLLNSICRRPHLLDKVWFFCLVVDVRV